MAGLPDDILRLAEEPDGNVVEPLPPVCRIRAASFTLMLSPTPTLSMVSGVRTTASALDATIAEARGLVRAAGYQRTTWSVGPSSRPAGLVEMLLARGFVPANRPPFEPEQTAMALTQPPPPPAPGVEARRVESLEEYLEAWRIAIETFNESEEDAAGWLSAAPALWKQQDFVARFAHLAWIDGRPVGFGFAYAGTGGLLLGGSGVLASARGRGAYGALVAARWTEAVRLGKPALVIQAGAMARPILDRCGFEAICRLDVLEDPNASRD